MLARKDDDAAANSYEGGVELVLDQTAEFCRGLGEVDKINQIPPQNETVCVYIYLIIRLAIGKICNLV